YSGGLHLDPHQIGLDRCPIALDDFHRLSSSPTNRSCVCRSDEFASARARRTDAPLSSAPGDQGWPYVPLYTRNPLFAFFSFFAARFSIRLLAGFFFASFFVSIALLITGSSDWREESAFCAKVSCLGRTSWNEPARGVHRDNLLTDHRPALGAGKAARASRSSRS